MCAVPSRIHPGGPAGRVRQDPWQRRKQTDASGSYNAYNTLHTKLFRHAKFDFNTPEA